MSRLLIIFIAFIHHTRGDDVPGEEDEGAGISDIDVRNDSRHDLSNMTLPMRNKFLQNLYKIVQSSYDTANSEENIDRFPTEALNGIYVECILGLSFPCLQKKMINFLSKLDKMRRIDLIGKSIVVVRKAEHSSDAAILAKIAEYVDPSYLKDFIDHLIDVFFDNHVLRVKIPSYFQENSSDDVNETTFVDIDFGVQRAPASSRDGKIRKSRHPHHHGKIRGLKKLLMLMGLLMCMKLSMMGPLMLGVIGLKAMKALILAVMSITISKMMMLGKGGHLSGMLAAHDTASSGSGWDRTIQEQYTSTSSLPYHIEPPVPYNSYTVQ
ncbi:uncharacterized protein LOC135841481 [Planococcus citri]|uniref:uncharacterized protein LOC135841481 n=1 Tax=Planococcus citri TaxID=170843 RepID=UPI0031F90229